MDSLQTPYGGAIPVSQEQDHVRENFIRKTFLHLALAVLGFILVEFLFLNTPGIVRLGLQMTQGITWLLVLGGFMLVTSFAERWARNSTDKRIQYAGLALYIIAQAFIFVPLLFIAMLYSQDGMIIKQAMILTLALFGGLTAIAFFSGKDFSFLGGALKIGGFVALGLIAGGLIFGFSLGLWFSVAMVVFAGAAILYQTSNIFNHYHKDQYVAASLGLFASLMLLFWYILQILISLSGD